MGSSRVSSPRTTGQRGAITGPGVPLPRDGAAGDKRQCLHRPATMGVMYGVESSAWSTKKPTKTFLKFKLNLKVWLGLDRRVGKNFFLHPTSTPSSHPPQALRIPFHPAPLSRRHGHKTPLRHAPLQHAPRQLAPLTAYALTACALTAYALTPRHFHTEARGFGPEKAFSPSGQQRATTCVSGHTKTRPCNTVRMLQGRVVKRKSGDQPFQANSLTRRPSRQGRGPWCGAAAPSKFPSCARQPACNPPWGSGPWHEP